jgi:hypothetical protein
MTVAVITGDTGGTIAKQMVGRVGCRGAMTPHVAARRRSGADSVPGQGGHPAESREDRRS